MPISRILYPPINRGHLSFICDTDCSVPVAPNPPMFPTLHRDRSSRSRPPVYMGLQSARFALPVCLHDRDVRFYRTFSPLLPIGGSGYFLWHCLVSCSNSPDVIGVRRSALSGLSSPRISGSDRSTYSLSVKLYVYFIRQSYIA